MRVTYPQIVCLISKRVLGVGFFFLIFIFIHSFLAVLGLRCFEGFSLVVAHVLLVMVASLVVSTGSRARGLSRCSFRVPECRLSSCGTWA